MKNSDLKNTLISAANRNKDREKLSEAFTIRIKLRQLPDLLDILSSVCHDEQDEAFCRKAKKFIALIESHQRYHTAKFPTHKPKKGGCECQQ